MRIHSKVHILFRSYAEFLVLTGLRREEALRLTTNHIDFERRVIYIEKTKDKEMRVIPLHPRAIEILRSLDEELFHSLAPVVVSHKFAAAAKKAGLKGFKLHSLRHTFATKLVASGVDIYTVSKLLGHSDIKTTMVYAKVAMSSMESAIGKLQLQLSGGLVRERGVGWGVK